MKTPQEKLGIVFLGLTVVCAFLDLVTAGLVCFALAGVNTVVMFAQDRGIKNERIYKTSK